MTERRARTVAVIGGGLAGITAALGCADAGCNVTLFESRARLGGLTHSFRRGGLWVDNGQHVFLRCCTSYLGLLERLGVADRVHVQQRLDVPVLSGRHPGTGRLRRTGLPAPLHLAAALAGYRWLGPAERLQVVRAALALRRVDRSDPATDAVSFGDWLAGHGQSPRAVEALWDLVGVATLNAPAKEASLALAATVFQVGLLGDRAAADIGWSAVPLQQLHGDAAARALAAAGVQVHTRVRVAAVLPVAGVKRGWHVAPDPRPEVYDDVVLAAPPPVTETLVPEGALGTAPGWAKDLGSSPIVNVHLRFDRQVLSHKFAAAVDSPLQWVFDRTTESGLAGTGGQYLVLSLSAADGLAHWRTAALRSWVLPHLQRLLPDSPHARLEDFFVTREPHATFRPLPGSAARRPPTATRSPGLHLAGAWTDTGWPATMEGAVRSGAAAAAGVIGSGPTRTSTGATVRPSLEEVPA